MAEWRLLRGWTDAELEERLAAAGRSTRNFPGIAAGLTPETGWNHVSSRAVVARESPGPPGELFASACRLVGEWAFSDPRIVAATFGATAPLDGRTMLLELRTRGPRYLCAVRLGAVRTEEKSGRTVFSLRCDTLAGHIERGSEWFRIEKDHATGELVFGIRAVWRPGEFPNSWSAAGFRLVGRRYQRAWHRLAHLRLHRLLAAAPLPAPRPGGLLHEGPPLKVPRVSLLTGAAARAEHFMDVAAEEREMLPIAASGRKKKSRAALGLAALSGVRSMLPLALAAGRFAPRRIRWALGFAAAAEAVADKAPGIPARTVPVSLAGRALSGGAVAALLSPSRARSRAAVTGAAAAVGGAFAAYHLRRIVTRRLRVPDVIAGVAEDAFVAGAGRTLLARA